jgi:hypothetical protein
MDRANTTRQISFSKQSNDQTAALQTLRAVTCAAGPRARVTKMVCVGTHQGLDMSGNEAVDRDRNATK